MGGASAGWTPMGDGGMGDGGDGGDGGSDEGCAAHEFSDEASCHQLTVCVAGEYEKSSPTPTTDRECIPCEDGTFSGSVNATSCMRWAQCKSGESESVPPSPTSDRVCSTCGAGKYEASGQCLTLSICSAQQYELTPATATSDRKCSAVTSCQPGSSQTAAATATTDRQCAACGSGSFSTQSNAAFCKPWTVCTVSQTQSMAGSTTSDVMCVDKPVCSTAKERTCTTQCPCASSEGVCTASNQCVTGATCVAGSGKKVGRAGDTCLADHCNNDKLDGGETSVDCGGGCGCLATFEIVSIKNLPAGATITSYPRGMSRDGKQLVGDIARGQSSYPAVFAYDGTVTELESYGKGGSVYGTNGDGSVSVGVISCTNPPACTISGSVRWSGSGAPTVLGITGTVRATSSSGSIYAGDGGETSAAFLYNGTQRTLIPDLVTANALTPDGKYVAGSYKDELNGALWFVQTQAVTLIGAPNWTTSIKAANGTDPTVVGYAYISASVPSVAFRWKGGVITDLGLLAGGAYSSPNAVSFDGSTVVGVTGTNSYQQAFIWTDSSKMRSIVDELKARGVEPAVDLALPNADFISDDGKTIVGWLSGATPTFWRVVLQ